MRSLFTLVAVLLSLSSARAETIAVLRIDFDETAPALERQVLDALKKQLEERGNKVLLPADVSERLGERALPPGCRVGPCLRPLSSSIDVQGVLVATVAGAGSTYAFNMTLVEPHGGTVLAQVSDHCDVCTFEEASEAVGRASLRLVEMGSRQLKRRAWLVVRSTPSKAEVRLDGVPLGETPLRRLVAPGKRRLELERRESGVRVERVVTLSAGETSELTVDLASAAPAAADHQVVEPQAASSQPVWAWVSFGAGVSLTVLGTVLLALNDECLDQPECAESRRTRLPGAISAAAGLTTTLVSGVLFWRAFRRRSAPPSTTVGLALGPDTVGLTYGGSY
jgi:hypothetical protein